MPAEVPHGLLQPVKLLLPMSGAEENDMRRFPRPELGMGLVGVAPRGATVNEGLNCAGTSAQ